MKRTYELRTAALAALFLAVLCVSGYSAPTPEQRAERTNLLIQAIDNGNVEQAKACIKLGADVNGTVKKYGHTLPILIHAINNKNKEIAELLILAGANVNAKDDNGYTALTVTIEWGNIEIVELLIKAGADVNVRLYDGKTLLMCMPEALEKGLKDAELFAELLIKARADVNAKDDNGFTELMYAAAGGNIKI
ncbi:MAG: ankyrin repeat domain-containing protein, partial [Treponemataceae bacterium]|nr:ankyrin repeat domain-containing protein [Treponemataceae bacterium]